ncbi:Aldo/keto reductase [Mycena floridula]|nr:Aldo/keto reductase [Mycena floridula]
MVEKIPLNDGNFIPAIAFGTGTALYQRDATKSVVQAVESGFTHLDTAQIYQNEASVGDAIKQVSLDRSHLYITTKYHQGGIPRAIRESLSKLGIKYVDLYLIHNPSYTPDIPKAWREMEQIKAAGLTKSIGVSNFNVEQLKLAVNGARFKPAVNQISFNPYNYAKNKALLEYSASQGIVTEAYSSLVPITRNPGGPVDAPVAATAKRLGATPAQVIILWVRSKGVVVVTTSSNRGRLAEYLGISHLPALTKDEVRAIDEAGAKGP